MDLNRRNTVRIAASITMLPLVWAIPHAPLAQTADKTLHVAVLSSGVLELVINMKTAQALGVTIPQSLLLRADDVIQ